MFWFYFFVPGFCATIIIVASHSCAVSSLLNFFHSEDAATQRFAKFLCVTSRPAAFAVKVIKKSYPGRNSYLRTPSRTAFAGFFLIR